MGCLRFIVGFVGMFVMLGALFAIFFGAVATFFSANPEPGIGVPMFVGGLVAFAVATGMSH